MSRVLLTGANGFIRSHTLAPPRAVGHQVHAVSGAPREPLGDVTFHSPDVLNPGATPALAAEVLVELLLRLAWHAARGRFWTPPENARWLNAMLALLRASHEASGKHSLRAGSCASMDGGSRRRGELAAQ
jgi:nucleoside-diphosphate-sugar epimerase